MECRNSGLSDYQWCKRHDINPSTFYNWINCLHRQGNLIPEALSDEYKPQLKQEVVDADPQGSLSISLGFSQPDKLTTTISTIMGKVITDAPIEKKEGILSHEEGVDLLPANIELSGTEVTLISTMSRETILRQYLDTVKNQYDYILLDCMNVKSVMSLARTVIKIEPCRVQFLDRYPF